MKPSQKDLMEALGSMSPEEIEQMRQQSLDEKAKERQRKIDARCPYPIGTILFDDDDASIFWVRSAGRIWEPFIHDNHGVGIEDDMLSWKDLPKIGVMPAKWTQQQQRDHDEYYADED